MASTYTLNNGIELIGTGEQSGTWGDTTNDNLQFIDTALDGQVTITATSAGTSGSPNALPIADGQSLNSEGRNRMVIITSATDLGSTVYYQLTPNDAEKIIYIRNDLNAQDLIVFQGTYNSSNDYVVPNGTTAVIYFNGNGSGAVAANVFNNAYFDSLRLGSVSVTAILDEDDMSSDSATALATQQSIKAYVDTQITAEDLDFAGDSGTGAVDLDSQTFTIAGTTNEIETSASGQTLTVGLPDNVTIAGDLTVDTDTLYVDSTNNRVGIGDSTPSATLNVSNDSGGANTWTNAASAIIINETDASSPASMKFGPTTVSEGGQIVWGGSGGDGPFVLRNYNLVRLKIESDGRVLIGAEDSVPVSSGSGSGLQVSSTGSQSWISQLRYNNGASGPLLNLGKTRSATIGTVGTIVQDDDTIGTISFAADDGVDVQTQTARIQANVDGTPGANDMPGRLSFWTTADGASSVTERMRIDSNGSVGIGTTSPDGIFHAKDSSSSLMFKDVSGNAELFIDGSNGDFAGGDYFNIVADSSPNLMFKQANTERFRIDANGRILIATNTARSIVSNSGLALFQIESSSGGKPASSITMNSNSTAGPVAFFAKTRGTTNGSNTIVQDDDYYGSIQFAGADGTDTNTQAAMIAANVDGTPGANDMPGRLTFWTTADGASSGTERLRIDTNGLATFYYSTKNTRSVYGGYTAQTLENSNTNAGILTFTQQTWNSANGVGYIRMENSSATNVDSSEFTFHTGDGGSASEAMRITSAQKVIIGASSTRGTYGLTVAEPSDVVRFFGISSGGVDSLHFDQARGSVDSPTASAADGDGSYISFSSYDGTNWDDIGSLAVVTDGQQDAGRMIFRTTPTGGSQTERMRISSDGHMGFGTPTTTDVFYTFTKGGTDYTGDFATYNMGQMDSFRFYQSATTKWAKVFARSYQTPNQFGTQNVILEVMGHGSTGGNGHFVTLHVTTKQQQGSDGWDIYATGNNGYNVAYKYDATGGHESAGLLEIWVQPQENYVTTCLWVKTSQRRGDPTSEPVAWFGLEDTGSSTQPTGSTTVQQHNPFMGLHYKDGATNGTYETSENFQGWYPRLNINRYLDLGGQGTTKPTIGGSDNQIATISGTSNRATLNFFQSQSGSDGAKIRFAKGRSNSINGIGTAASDGDQTGIIINYVDDGTDLGSYSSYINFKVDGAVSSNDTPGKIVFATTADGSGASTDRIEIPQAGGILMKNSNTPTGGSGTTLHFNTGTRTVSSGTNAVVTLFNRSPDANVSSTGTCYVAAENSGGSVQFGYIIDFFYSNGTLQTTARETGSSQGTTTATIAESGTNLSITVTYAGGLGGAIRFNAGGTAINCSY